MVTSESVKAEHTPSAHTSQPNASTPQRSALHVVSKPTRHDLRQTLLPTPTRVYSDGYAMQRTRNRRVSQSPTRRTKSPFEMGHGSAPPGMQRPRSRSVRSDRKAKMQQAINLRQRPPSQRTSPKSITAESRSKSPSKPFVSDYSALCSMPHVMSTVRNVRASVDLAGCSVTDSVVLNNLHNVSSVDSTTQNNTSAVAQEVDEEYEYDLRFKIGSDVPDSISWDARRRFLIPSSKSPDVPTAIPNVDEETEDPNQGSPSSSLVQSAASSQKESQWTPFWMRSRPRRSKELPKSPVSKLLCSCKDPSVNDQSEGSFNDYAGLEGSASSNLSEGQSEADERLLLAAGRILGIPFRRLKSRSTDTSSLKSIEESSSAPTINVSGITASEKKKKSKVPKLVRRLGKTLAKKVTQADGPKPVNFRNVLRGFLSLQAVTVDDVLTTQQRAVNRKSSSSEDSLDSGKSIDLDEIKRVAPGLYSSIVETVEEWCEDPIAEPDEKSDHLSTRGLTSDVQVKGWCKDFNSEQDDKSDELSAHTFSSISFRDRPGGSQDLDNFEVGTELAREEAFLTDVIEGRIDARSICSDSPRKLHETTAVLTPRKCRTGEDRHCCSEMKHVLDAIDNLCAPLESADTPLLISDNRVDSPRQLSCLPFTDSESEEEKDVKGSANDFLHLTSSEIESFELDGLKEVFKMQGIWLFDRDRCAEIACLSEKWKKSAALQKFVDGASGFEISMDEGTVKCCRYPLPDSKNEKPMERVFLDGVPPASTSSTVNLKGTLTTAGLRTTCAFPDGSQREELVWIECDGLCVQISTELFSGERNVSRVYLKRPLFNSVD